MHPLHAREGLRPRRQRQVPARGMMDRDGVIEGVAAACTAASKQLDTSGVCADSTAAALGVNGWLSRSSRMAVSGQSEIAVRAASRTASRVADSRRSIGEVMEVVAVWRSFGR